ncbi:unnamed protein product [Hermetia illucens]|uniref:Cytochrome P450 n=2 Tax=Hermetia illucens TaxID=343691 RepID=A0A7R8V012_HERIL|nr:unnamed protein product [Hermetia illucens]
MFILTILTGIFAIIFIYFSIVLYRRRKFMNFLLTNFYSPAVDEFVGHVGRVPLDPVGNFQALAGKNGWFNKYGKNFVFVKPMYDAQLVLSRAEDIEKVLAVPNPEMTQKADMYSLLKAWLGSGLLLSWGDKWCNRRKIITPAFHSNILEGFIDVMNKQSDILVQKLKPNVGVGDVDIYPYTSLFTLDAIFEASMGTSVNAQSSPNSEYVQALDEISSIILERIFSIFSYSQFLYDLTSRGKREKSLRNTLHSFTEKVILERRNQLLNSRSLDNKSTKMSFLDVLLNSTLSNADICEELNTFIFKGHDTVTSGIAFALYYLSRNKNIQDRLYKELIDAFGEVNSIGVTYQKLADLRYLDMVVKETLRICPPIAIIGRKLREDTVLGDVNVPAGTNLILNIYALHNDPDYYRHPELFDPDRFDPLQMERRFSFDYVPFSAGGRDCIGQKFALTELKLVIAKLVMNFELLPAVDKKTLSLQGYPVLKSATGVHLRLAERKRNK